MYQAIVWIDTQRAQVLRLQGGISHQLTVAAPAPTRIDDPSHGAKQAPDEANAFFVLVASAVEAADELLVVGPSGVKHDFVKFMHQKDHGFDSRILGVETIDNPDDHRLAGYADIYFTQGGPRRSGQGSGYRETD
jgi:stalled ribosome rescue protein Dom34